MLENETAESIWERGQFISIRRAGGPGLTMPANTYELAARHKETMIKDSETNSFTSSVNWVSINPTGLFYAVTNNSYVSGRTNSVAFVPGNPNTMYIAAAQGGVWKTTNGGVNWVVLTDNLSTLACGDVVVNQANPSILYLGTGELNYSGDSHYGDGIFKSTDAGASWAQVAPGSLVGTRCSQMAIDPANQNTVYFAGNLGVFKSTNAGVNWVSTGSGNNANCILIDPANSQVIYITTGGYTAGLVKKSTDGAATWVTLGGGLPGGMGRVQLAMAPNSNSTLYASIAAPGGSLLGLYRTTDGGSTWTLRASSPNYLGSQGWYDNVVVVHPTNPDHVLVGGIDLYSSTTGGAGLVQKSAWASSNFNNFTHADLHRLAYNGSVLFCMSDGGAYKSTNDGTNWTDLNRTLSTLQYQSADYDPANLQNFHGGCQDNNKQYTNNGGTDWTQRTTGDGGYTIIDPVNTNYIYGQYVQGSIQRSVNSGIGYTNITPTGSTGGLFYNPYEMAPGDHLTIVFGRADIWKTTNAQTATTGSGWTQIAATGVVGGSVSAIGISWTNVDKIYIGTSNGRILVTSNNGSSWSTLTGYPYVSDFAVDNSDDNICYATLGGTTGTHVLKTTDGGATWSNITGNLPNIAANSIILRTAAPRMILAGTDIGVFQSTDEGASWISFNTGLPAVEIYDMKYKQANGIILAATHGRGCWIFDLASSIGIEDPFAHIPDRFILNQNYPNPFNPATKVRFALPKSAYVTIEIYDAAGRKIKELVNSRFNPGTFEVTWDASEYSSGVYFYKLIAEGFVETKKMLMVK
jgi:photosystem II stability/assembly factor-like uncharacterized protein